MSKKYWLIIIIILSVLLVIIWYFSYQPIKTTQKNKERSLETQRGLNESIESIDLEKPPFIKD